MKKVSSKTIYKQIKESFKEIKQKNYTSHYTISTIDECVKFYTITLIYLYNRKSINDQCFIWFIRKLNNLRKEELNNNQIVDKSEPIII